MNFTELENYMKGIDTNIIPDCEIAVYKDHKCLYKNSFSRPNYSAEESEKDLYYLFSASKVITCTAAMRLIEDKKLGLDDPVSKYLPEFEKLYVMKNGEKVPAENTLTVRHLMSMQGGFTYNLGFEGIKRIQRESGNKATTREVVSALAEMPLSFEPGENYQYSLCHDILAAVIEVVSGKKFSEYLDEVIFSPLGIKDITFVPTDDVMKRMKQQYVVDLRYFTAVPKTPECVYRLTDNYESGGAGMIASLNDYIKFADALACGESETGYRILKPETVELMKTNQLDEAGLKSLYFNCDRFLGYGYGLGVRTMMKPDLNLSLGPVGEFGWDGAAGAYCMIDTDNHLSIFYGQHVLSCGYAYQNVHRAIRNLVYKALEK